MIDLYDANRLITRRDRSLAVMAALLLLTSAAVASYAHLQQGRLQSVKGDLEELQTRVAQSTTPTNKPPAILAELLLQAEQLEREAALDGTAATPAAAPKAGEADGEAPQRLRASQWLHRLGLLAQPDISLHKVDVERSGEVHIEGLASDAEALNRFVQTWERQDEFARVQPRSIEVKQERTPSQQLRFHLRASPASARP